MALRIQTNVTALNAQRQLNISDSNMSKSLERLSSGFRINRAGDDVAGLSMSAKFVAQIRSMSVASRNASQANSLLQIAEGGTEQIGNILTRLKELATQAASANSAANLTDINGEATALKAEIDRIANSTTFQGTALLTGYGIKTSGNALTAMNAYDLDVSGASSDAIYSVSQPDATHIKIKNMTTGDSSELAKNAGAGSYSFGTLGISFKTTGADEQSSILALVVADLGGANTLSVNNAAADFQVGESNGLAYRISFQLNVVTSTSLSVNGIDLSSASGAQTAMGKIDLAIKALVTERGNIGAIMNRLEYTSSNLAIAIENASAANSVIKDVDMAMEMTNFTKTQILVQAGTAMLGQANMAPQSVLSLISG